MKAIRAYDEPVRYTERDIEHILHQIRKFSENPYQE